MKRITLLHVSGLILLLFLFSNCSNSASNNRIEQKADSLERRIEHAMDSANEANIEKINAMSDSDIINDPGIPEKRAQ